MKYLNKPLHGPHSPYLLMREFSRTLHKVAYCCHCISLIEGSVKERGNPPLPVLRDGRTKYSLLENIGFVRIWVTLPCMVKLIHHKHDGR